MKKRFDTPVVSEVERQPAEDDPKGKGLQRDSGLAGEGFVKIWTRQQWKKAQVEGRKGCRNCRPRIWLYLREKAGGVGKVLEMSAEMADR